MKSKHWWQRPGILAVVIIGGLLLTTYPYFRSVRREYDRFHTYAQSTLHSGENPPWEATAYTPEQCARTSLEWLADCPGIDDFCIDGVREVTKRCMKSQDRTEWCKSHRKNWATTNFGYHWCKDGEKEADRKELIKAYDDACDISWRVMARHCERLIPLVES